MEPYRDADNDKDGMEDRIDPSYTCWIASDPLESRRITLTAAIWASSDATNLQKEFAILLSESLKDFQFQVEQYPSGEEAPPPQETWFVALQSLRWLDRGSFVAPILAKLLHANLSAHIAETIMYQFDRDDFHETTQQWKDSILLPWTYALVGPRQGEQWAQWLQHLVADCLVQCRLTQLFDIIRDYPDSKPSIHELGVLLRTTQLHSKFLSALINALCQRLLHPGASTSQIIDVYINTIKFLRHVDPSDRLLQQVAEPVRTYLRGRSDTVRCIITNLTDQGADLYQELRQHGPLEDTIATNSDAQNDDQDMNDEDEPPGMDWMPPPPLHEERVTFFEGQGRNLDILSILVSIYGSKVLFVDEYRLMLADRLLATLDFNTDSHVHTLELLKLRFGDVSMRHCEIMIKDMDESKRIVSNIHSTMNANSRACVVDAAIISHIFWPSILSQESMQHHPRIQEELDAFSAEYGKLKNPRRLIWYNQLGMVELELDLWEGGILVTKQVTCPPLMATLIAHFEDKNSWTAEELCNSIGIPDTLVQKRMQFWINHRVVVVKSNTYYLASPQDWSEEDHETNMMVMTEDEDSKESIMIGGNDEAEQVQVLTSYIIGMLKRCKELPLNRIHEMLKLFANGSDHAYNKTPRQLTVLLQKLCRDERLECGPTGVYKLVEK